MSTSMLEEAEAKEKAGKEIWDKMYGEKNPPEDGKGKTGDPAPKVKPKEEPKPEDKPKEEPKAGEKPKEEPKPEDKSKEEPKPEDFKHKYEVLQGKYNAEVLGVAFQLGEATKENARLQKELEEAKKPKEEPKKEPDKPKEEHPAIKRLKEEYPETYEGINILMKEMISEHLPTKKIEDIDKRVDKVEKGVGEVQKDIGLSAKETYLKSMDADPDIGKDWRKINEDEGFIASLEEIEPYSGKKKKDLLLSAWNSMDPVRTLRFFKDFKASKPKETPKEEPKEDIDIHPPEGGKGDIGRKKDTGEIITPEKVAQFYKDVADGKYKGKDAEMEKEEKRIHDALFKKRQT